MSTDPFVVLEQTVAALRAQARPAGPDGPYIVALDLEADGIERAVATLRPAYAMIHGEREAARDLAVVMERALRDSAADLADARTQRDAFRKDRNELLRSAPQNGPVGRVPIDGLGTERIGEACRGLALELLRVAEDTGDAPNMLEIRVLRSTAACPGPPPRARSAS